MNIISLQQEEFQENSSFVFSLLEKGHTVKIVTNGGMTVLMTPMQPLQTQQPEINIPNPEEFQPDPAMVKEYVTESLGEMTQDF